MRIINLNPVNIYSCASCQKSFESKTEILYTPLCSSKCRFILIMDKLRQYSNADLKIMYKEAFPDYSLPQKRSDGIRALAKFIEASQ